MKWTQAQQDTIETRGCNVLVSAAAGSGKTTVLIERIKTLVLRDRVDIDRFLITTFTNAAAAEMKEKMEKAIRQEMEEARSRGEEDKESLAFLQRQMDLLPMASISTFHTFALGIIRDFFYLTDLSPGFSIGDETRLSIMRRDSIDEVFERRLEEDTDRFQPFLRKYSRDRNDERLKDQLLDIYQQMRSIPSYMKWAKDRTELLGGEDPLKDLGIDRFLMEETADALRDSARWYKAAADFLDRPDLQQVCLLARSNQQQVEILARKAAEIASSGDPEEFEQLKDQLAELKLTTIKAPKEEKPVYDPLKKDFDSLRNKGRDIMKGLTKKYFALSREENNAVLQAGQKDTEYFIELIAEFEQVYREKKREKDLIDFDDCMHYCIQILEDENAAADYRDRFRYIFIDEYQDSNLLQEEIVGAIAREDNLFMVGDVKQSIYKFRLAEPEIFRDRYDRYRAGEEGSRKIDLNTNFRSRRTIRDVVNRIFGEIMDGYDEDAQLNGPEGQEPEPGFPVSLHILTMDVPEDPAGPSAQADPADDEEGADPAEALSESQVIASIIRDHIGRQIIGKDGQPRTIGYGDIAVLFRGRAGIPQIERYLNNEGIPAFGETEGGYYETVEIQVFLNLLKIISNQYQDIPLISAMSSVAFDFSPMDLARIRIEFREGSFHQAVMAYREEGSDRLIREKIRAMMDQIDLWKEMGRTLPLDELMRILLYETGYYDYCSGLPTGQQRVSNLRLLLEKAAAFEETSHLGLYGFLEYVEAMRRTRQKVSEASLSGEGKSVVRVMTVHKSKGLEFPVVILAGAGRQITSSSSGRAPSMHKAFAIGLAEVNPDQRWERRTILQRAIDAKKRREDLEEEIRILYVALTRPMQKLAIVGSVKSADGLRDFPQMTSFLDMIYSTMQEMAVEDPESAQVFLYGPRDLPETTWDQGQEDAGGSCREEEPEKAGLCAAAEGEEPSEIGEELPDPEEELLSMEEIDRRLGFAYPYERKNIKTKYSVTELSSMEASAAEVAEEKIPQLWELPAGDGSESDGETELTAAQIGTAMHAVMERIDYGQALDKGADYIVSVADRMLEKGILTRAERQAIDPQGIDAFFRHPVGERAARSGRLRKEKPFLLSLEIEGEATIVQGVIDCCFEEEDGLVLIDFKNSWARTDQAEAEVIDRYRGQIRIYRRALEEAAGKPVKESYLYLFRSHKFIEVN